MAGLARPGPGGAEAYLDARGAPAASRRPRGPADGRLGRARVLRVGRQLGDQHRATATTAGCSSSASTWRDYGGSEFAADAPTWRRREQQIVVAERILDDVGCGAWPACSRRLGLR